MLGNQNTRDKLGRRRRLRTRRASVLRSLRRRKKHRFTTGSKHQEIGATARVCTPKGFTGANVLGEATSASARTSCHAKWSRSVIEQAFELLLLSCIIMLLLNSFVKLRPVVLYLMFPHAVQTC